MLYRLLTLVALSLVMKSSLAAGAEFALALAGVEEGDDRFRPAAGAHVAWQEKYYGGAYLYGRKYGPVSERTFLLSAARRLGVFNSKQVQAGFGLTGLLEQTEVSYSGEFKDQSTSDNRFNFGGLVGLYWNVPSIAPVYAVVGWESHLFLAGAAGILLSTGRKQVFSVGAGWALK